VTIGGSWRSEGLEDGAHTGEHLAEGVRAPEAPVGDRRVGGAAGRPRDPPAPSLKGKEITHRDRPPPLPSQSALRGRLGSEHSVGRACRTGAWGSRVETRRVECSIRDWRVRVRRHWLWCWDLLGTDHNETMGNP